MKRTEGFWKVEDGMHVLGDGEAYVCDASVSEMLTEDEKMGNAILIAAAPKMLQFLKHLVRNCNEKEPLSFDTDKLEALKIIAEVEGKI